MTTSRLRVRCTTLLALAIVAVACQDKLPTGPSDLLEGIVIYEDANYLGRSAHVTADVTDLKDFDGPCEHPSSSGTGTDHDWNDCVSSVRVAPGWTATLYRDDDFKGQSFVATEGAPNLQLVPGSCSHDGLNDCVTSIRVYQN